MSEPAVIAPAPAPEDYDQRVILHDVSWEQFETILAIRGDRAGVRMAYLDGELELMSPSRGHERLKKLMSRLLEAWANERGIELEGYGSETMLSARGRRGAEPDECYAVGGEKERADLAIEVVWTSGGLDKLAIYRGLGVREVWVWERERFGLYAIRGDRYEPIERSLVLPDFDLALFVSFLGESNQSRAVRAFRATLRGA